MLYQGLLAGCAIIGLLLTAAPVPADDARDPSVASQSEPSASLPGVRGQSNDDKSLEIAPQNANVPARPDGNEIPADRSFKPSDDLAALDRNFHPRAHDDGTRPYLGISVQYTTQCYLGMEEHGLEVMSVHPDSPAGQAGIKGITPPSALGAMGAVAGTLLGPVNLLVTPLLEKSGALGMGGDLIVAVDDRRVRGSKDLEAALKTLKPGDTMYLTIIRPLPGGAHRTMKIAIKIGAMGQPLAKADGSGDVPSSSSGAENYAY
jgi:S1-C subfamily serine protease